MTHPIDTKELEISPSVEDYLTAIYRLEQTGAPAETKRMGEALGGLRSSSVTGMVKRLAGSGLIEYRPYQGVSLTPRGRGISLGVLRRHRLIELFLVKELGYPWEEVHEEADRLEHSATPRFIEKIAEKLGFPEYDPHGDPIPDLDGCLPARETMPLADCAEGRTMLVFRVLDQSAASLASYREQGFMPGRMVTVTGREGSGSTLIVQTEDRLCRLERREASRILVIRSDMEQP